jgi:hypothetical protein
LAVERKRLPELNNHFTPSSVYPIRGSLPTVSQSGV